jgi:hypothetical protein
VLLISTQPTEIGYYDTPGDSRSVIISRTQYPDKLLAYIADGNMGLRVIDVTNPQNPMEIGFIQTSEFTKDVQVDGDYAYLANGKDGIWVVNISNPEQPAAIGYYDTPGGASGLDFENSIVYVADSDRGMRVINVQVPQIPNEIGFYEDPRDVHYVEASGDFAYVTDGNRGFRSIDVSDPMNQKVVGFYDQLPQPKGLYVRESVSYIANATGLSVFDVNDPQNINLLGSINSPGTGENVVVHNGFAYLADGDFGMRIIDVSESSHLIDAGFLDTLGYARGIAFMDGHVLIADGAHGLHIVNVEDNNSPITSSTIEEFKDAKDVIVDSSTAYIANGEYGLAIANVSDPGNPEILAEIETHGEAVGIAVSGSYVFLADGNKGLQIFYAGNPSRPILIGSYENPGGAWDVDVTSRIENENRPKAFYVYIAARDQGLLVFAVNKAFFPIQMSLYETPGTASIQQIISYIKSMIPGLEGEETVKAIRTIRVIMIDLFLVGFLGLLIWLSFFAQFVLPLRSVKERWQATNRLVDYAFRREGPAIRVEDGEIIRRSSEKLRGGSGVALLDSASAAMLRTKTAFTRSVGPGVVFTKSNEFINREAFDLHKQPQPDPPLGPLGGEDPFEERPPTEDGDSTEVYEKRQKRRNETSGLTRDGVEVIPKIHAVIKLISKRGEGGTQFGYKPESIRLAATKEGIVPMHLRNVRWFELPAYIAVDVWREYLGKFTLDELFAPDTAIKKGIINDENLGKPTQGETGLEIVRRMVTERFTCPKVDRLDEVGSSTGEKEISREYQLVANMGIQVYLISLSDFCFPPAIEKKLVYQWISTWLDRAEQERIRVEKLRTYIRMEGEQKAILAFADSAITELELYLERVNQTTYTPNLISSLDIKTSLELLLSGTHKLTIRDTTLHNMMDNQEKEIEKLLEWVRFL